MADTTVGDTLLANLREAVAKLPDTPEAREEYYGELLSKAKGARKVEARLHAAISTIEDELSTRRFPAPADAPRSTIQYFWIQVSAGRGTVTAAIDLLKPIANLQTMVASVALVAAIALSAANRQCPYPGRRSRAEGRAAVDAGVQRRRGERVCRWNGVPYRHVRCIGARGPVAQLQRADG